VCEGPFEIVSLVGVIASPHAHLHISLSDSKGQVIGGHLVEDDIIYTTAEVNIHSAHTYSIHIKFILNSSKFIVTIPHGRVF